MDINQLKLASDVLVEQITALSAEIAELETQRLMKISDRTKLSSINTTISVAINAYDKAVEALTKAKDKDKDKDKE